MTEYIATEFAGDPPAPVARWYKIQAGTYARYAEDEVQLFWPADLRVEQSEGHHIEHVPGDGDEDEMRAVQSAWERSRVR